MAGGTNEDPTFKPEMSAVDNPKDILDRLFAYDFEGIPPSLPALRRTRVQEVLDELRTKPDTVAFEEVYQVVKGDRVSFSDLLAPLLVRLNAGQAKWGNNTRTAHQDNVLIHVHEDDVSVGT